MFILLLQSSDFVRKGAERAKFGRDRRSFNPILSSSTMHFVSLALNYLGLRGPHFQAFLKEFASIMVTKPEGCYLLKGSFALTHTGALHNILRTRGARIITWTTQREHAGQIVRGIQALYYGVAFTMKWGAREGCGLKCLSRALSNFGDPNIYYIDNMAWFVSL